MTNYVKLPNLLKNKQLIESSFEQLAEQMAKYKKEKCIRIITVEKNEEKLVNLHFGNGIHKVDLDIKTEYDLEVKMKLDDWISIIRGEISPLEILMKGRMAIGGDLQLGTSILKIFASQNEKYNLCE